MNAKALSAAIFLLVALLVPLTRQRAQSENGATLQGKLTDAVTGAPLAAELGLAIHTAKGVEIKHTRANEQGEFQFTALPTGSFHLSTKHETYASETASVSLQANEARSLDLRLHQFEQARGRVFDANRNPVAEARVQVCYEQETGFANRYQWEEGDVRTDADGRFAIAVHPARPYVVQISRAGFLSAVSSPQRATSELALTLSRGVPFSGKLTDDAGRPLANAQVQLSVERENVTLNRFLPFELLQQINQTTTTQADGTFEFANVSAAPHTLTVTHPQTEPKRIAINLRRAQKLDLTLTRK